MNIKALYVHIPFCDHICGYCDFTRFIYGRQISDRFMMRLISQINQLPNGLETIYVGGGTPTSLQDDQLEGLLQALQPHLAENAEFTFEGNPENLTEDKVAMLVKYGVNRMSLGLQATQDVLLMEIGRHHNFNDVKRGVELLRSQGIHNISLDLMYGLPKQTMAMFEESITKVLELQPNHVSIYALIIEPYSEFGKKNLQPVSIDEETDMYLKCIEMMTKNGYDHYEISNFSLPGQRSEHNQVYWRYEDFYALGPGSSMKVNHQRKTWTRSLKYYLQEDRYDEVIDLTKKEEMFEFIMMGLRLKDGITFKRFYDRFEEDVRDVYPRAIQQGVEAQLLILDDEKFYASDEGFIMLDDILIPFMD